MRGTTASRPLLPVDDIRAGGLHIYKSGEGVRLTDYDGNVYLDMMSLPYPRQLARLRQRRDRPGGRTSSSSTLHYVGTVANFAEPTIRLAKTDRRAGARASVPRLLRQRRLGGGRGRAQDREAVSAVQSGRKPRAYKIISRWNAYHGATMGALAATDWLDIRHISEPGVPGYSFVPGPMNYRNPFGMDGGGLRRALRRPISSSRSCTRGRNRRRLHRRADHAGQRRPDPARPAISSACARSATSTACSGSSTR